MMKLVIISHYCYYGYAKQSGVISVTFLQLGERNAIAFNLDMAQTVPFEDLPDDFFELTLEDVRGLYKDLRRRR
jgi:hypothetical protein